MKTVYFSAQGPRSESDRELYTEAIRMMSNIEAFAAQAQSGPIDDEENPATVIVADQPCHWEGSESTVELTAHAVLKVDTAAGEVLACHGVQASSEVDSFTFRRGNDGARLYDWSERDGSRKIHVYSGDQSEIAGFLVIVEES